MRDLLLICQRAYNAVWKIDDQNELIGDINRTLLDYQLPAGQVDNATVLTDRVGGYCVIIPFSPSCYVMTSIDVDSVNRVECKVFNISALEMRQFIEHELPYCHLSVVEGLNYLGVCNK